MSDSEVEPEPEPEPQPRRGRPSGQTDAGKRYRRTAAEISADKIRVAEMRLQALREAEERKHRCLLVVPCLGWGAFRWCWTPIPIMGSH